ncbi:MAG: hypothetical protein ABFC96_05555 [Thermoguttaceae bacterium]
MPVDTPPSSPAPRFGIAVLRDDRSIEVRYTESTPVWESHIKTKTYQVEEGDKWIVKTETTKYKVRRYQTKVATETRPVGQYRVYIGGRMLDEKALAEVLKKPRRIAFLEGVEPNEFYLDLLKDDSVVVTLRGLTELEQKAMPAAPARNVKDSTPRLHDSRATRGRWWERLSLVPEDAPPVGDRFKGLQTIQIDPGAGLLYVRVGQGANVARQAWAGPRLISNIYEITWFGHNDQDKPKGAAKLCFEVGGRGTDSRETFLSVADVASSPRLVLTTDPSKANAWKISAEHTNSETDKWDQEWYEDQTAGYVEVADIPNVRLWLTLSDEPIMQKPLVGAKSRETVEYRAITVSREKKSLFRYTRGWTVPN